MPDQIGPYRLLSRLDAGGMGTAWRAIDTRTEREVAIKVLHAELADDPESVERLLREEKFARIVRHPHIVQVLDAGVHEGRAYLAMELVDGESLKRRIQRVGALSPDEALRVTWCVARALAEAHDVGVIHRDIKPGNILIDRQGNVKVTDFGIARASEFSTLTMTGMFLGAPAYAAPEAIDGELDARSDLYSLGITFYEMLFARLPFEGGDASTMLRRHATLKPDLRPLKGVPPRIAEIVTRLLRRNPRERYQSAHALIDAIAAVRAAPPLRASAQRAAPPPPPPPPRDETELVARGDGRRGRNLWPIALGAAGGIAVAGVLAFALLGGGDGGGDPSPTPNVVASPDHATVGTSLPPPVDTPAVPAVRPTSGIVSNTEPDICVNIRAEPSTTAQIRRCAVRGERLAIVTPQFRFAENLVWWEMRANDNASGWVAEQFLLLSTGSTPVGQTRAVGTFTITLVTAETMLGGRIAVVTEIRNTGPVTDFSARVFQDGGLTLVDVNGASVASEESANLVVGNALEPDEAVTGWHRFDASALDTSGTLTIRLDDGQTIDFTIAR